MVTIRIPITYPSADRPSIPVKITNPETKKSITISMLLDTGWDMDRVDARHGQTLGYIPTNAPIKGPDYNAHFAQMNIGTLKPITTLLCVSTGNPGLNVFGNLPMRQYDRFAITSSSATITDSTTGGGTEQGLLAAMKDFTKYTYVGGVPRLTRSVPQQQSAYARAYYAMPSWKKRI